MLSKRASAYRRLTGIVTLLALVGIASSVDAQSGRAKRPEKENNCPPGSRRHLFDLAARAERKTSGDY